MVKAVPFNELQPTVSNLIEQSMFRRALVTILLLNVYLLQACGGGSDAAAPVDTLSSPSPAPSTPVTPTTPTGNSAPVVSGTVPVGKENDAFKYTPVFTDADGDTLTLSVTNLPAWLEFNASTGEFAGTPGADQVGETDDIELIVSDGEAQTRFTFTIEVRFDEVEQALRTGDHNYFLSEEQIISSVLSAIENNLERYRSTKNQLFNLGASGETTSESLTQVSWDPTQDAALLNPRFGSNEAILTTNSVSNPSYVVQKHALAIAGESEHGRYAAFGSNPMRNSQRSDLALSDDMQSLLVNTINWLVARTPDASQPLNIVLSQLDESTYFPDQSAVRSWLDRTYGDSATYNNAQKCNSVQLQTCVSEATDLLLISPYLFSDDDAQAIASQVQTALQNGVAVLYFHHDGDLNPLAERLLALLDIDYHGDNYWRKLTVENYDASSVVTSLPADVAETRVLLSHFRDQTFSANLGECEDKSCPNASPYYSEFIAPVETLQGQLRDMDKQGVRLFETSDYRYHKLLVLLGDYYRQGVNYPMDKNITPKTLFLRSMYADHTVYYSRSGNQAQRDMGNFSRSRFTHVTPKNRRVSMAAKAPFRSTGAYALPGVPFTVNRHDTIDVEIHVFINTLRSGATHEFDEFGYARPKYLQSSEFKLEEGKPLVLTSPHGGPIQLSFSHADEDIEVEFINVGEHPYWTTAADDETFTAQLEQGDYDWAELVTTHFEVHSTLEKMRTTVRNPIWESPSEIAEAIATYTHNNPHVLAGYQGPGIEVIPEIHDFAAANGLQVIELDTVKHMNADQATCGYGCSGNPYDAYWSFDPLGHGDLHEMGHSLERSRFRFAGWDSHSSTNYYSYYSKYRYFVETGDTEVLGGCQNLPFSKLLTAV